MPCATSGFIERLLVDGEDRIDLWGPFPDPDGDFFRLQFYSLSKKYLNDLMPILENLGLCVIDEVDFALEVQPQPVHIKSFAVRGADRAHPNLASLRQALLDAFLALHRGLAENDYLNRLLIPTGLDWKQIDVFRGYRNYYFQLGSPFTKKRVAFALINNPRVARLLYDYFAARFHPDPRWEDPARREEEGLSPLRQQLVEALEVVADTNEDRILRTLFNLIDSTVRTNFFLRRERDDYFFAFKISALGIIEMPAPRPLFEIYVHAANMEGIHLRGGKVARGGIRWSDRPDDFRTEILGLMKTQMSKNALIVPVGSKGGFVVKTPFSQPRGGGAPLPGSLPGADARPARSDRQPRRRDRSSLPTRWSPTTSPTPTWWSPPTRGRRSFPTPPTPSAGNTASGSTTPSPAAVPTATTTRLSASPPAAPGNA